jgi:hypothetical protein
MYAAMWGVLTLPLLSRLWIGSTSNDVRTYWRSAEAVLGGAALYRDVPFEYPPYAMVWFLGPAWVSGTLADFRLAFGLLIWTVDALVKAVLIRIGAQSGTRFDWKPVVLYSIATAAGGHYLLQRYDVIPAAVAFASFLALARGWPATSGALLVLAAGTKLYPALLFPVMAAAAWRLGRPALRRFVAGGVTAGLPLVGVAPWMPWWRFASQHIERGLEVESLWASGVWLLHFAGIPATWEFARAWNEVGGPVAAALVTPARLVWITATVASIVVSTRRAWRLRWPSPPEPPVLGDPRRTELAMLLLLPVATFTVTNPVLSPQFHLWLLPWCALVLAASGRHHVGSQARHAALCLLLSMLVVPSFYPTRAFAVGLDLGRTLCLVFRNVLLFYGTVRLWQAVAARTERAQRSDSPGS